MVDPQIRQCRQCGELKPIEEFQLCSPKASSRRRVCYPCNYRRVREWYGANKDKVLRSAKARYDANPSVNRTPEERAQINTRIIKRSRLLRDDVIGHYGRECVACGETEPLFLTLDHIDNDGVQMRKVHGTGYALYRWIRKNGYPASFEILCMNCNFGKARNGGVLVRDRRRDKGRFND